MLCVRALPLAAVLRVTGMPEVGGRTVCGPCQCPGLLQLGTGNRNRRHPNKLVPYTQFIPIQVAPKVSDLRSEDKAKAATSSIVG